MKKNRQWISENEIAVLDLHSKKISPKEISIELNTTEYLINKVLKSNGLSGGTKFSRLPHQEIIELYSQNHSADYISKQFNVSEPLVIKILKSNNVFDPQKKVDMDVVEVINLYKKHHKAAPVAEHFGVANSTILKILHNNNVRVSKIRYTNQEIIDHYYKVKTIVKTCKDLNISDGYVRDILIKNKVPYQSIKRRVEVGDVYSYLTVIKELQPKYKSGGGYKKMLQCQCKCGNIIERSSISLRKQSRFKSCGCYIQERIRKNEEERIRKNEEIRINRELKYEKKVRELEIARIEKLNKPKEEHKLSKYVAGYKKDKLTIISVEGKHPNKFAEVLCECGKRKKINVGNLTQTKSCGCLQVERSSKHGLAPKNDDYRRKWYDRWRGMISRCHNPKNGGYVNYGGRGITVCDRWRELGGVGCKNYIEDIQNILGPQPTPEHSLDRINNDGMYEITNLRWATKSLQNKNKRHTRRTYIK